MTTAEGIRWAEMPNHFAPRIAPDSKGVGDVVIHLKRPADTTPDWVFPPLVIEQKDLRIQARQDDRVGQVGFVRVGDEVEMASRDLESHSLRARGASYFTLPFPSPNQPLKRTFNTPGHVEFTSAAGYFWSAVDLFVCEHEYYTATDTSGRFELKNVPPGEYELVAWLRNWELLDRDHDPETGRVMRVKFAAPFETIRKVTVVGGKMAELNIEFSTR